MRVKTLRILSLVFSLVVAVALAVVALIYLGQRVGQQRIYVQDGRPSSDDVKAYRGYGDLEQTSPDTAKVTLGDTVAYPHR
jgi:hypothetical protein